MIALIALAGSIFRTGPDGRRGTHPPEAARSERCPREHPRAVRPRSRIRTAVEPLQHPPQPVPGHLSGLGKVGKGASRTRTTLYVFAQFFGWREIIRREIQFWRRGGEETRKVSRLLRHGVWRRCSQPTPLGPQFMIWRIEQRGLGERMILTSDGKPTCMGYATFIDSKSTMKEWLDPLETDLRRLDERGRNRLTKLQALLRELRPSTRSRRDAALKTPPRLAACSDKA